MKLVGMEMSRIQRWDVPGECRWPAPSLQHEVMIEAVENHNPEAIVIDEIGRELEAEAARTIAERGVQLIGTAHGNSLENLLLNPTLSDLVGGIESVTLSDEEARRRGTQKTVLERRAPPTFDVLIEIQTPGSGCSAYQMLPQRLIRCSEAIRSQQKSENALMEKFASNILQPARQPGSLNGQQGFSTPGRRRCATGAVFLSTGAAG